MAEGLEDRRIRRTRAAITQALMDLVAQRPYDEITVSDLTDAAGVGRSTFYQHYANKEEVLRAVTDGGLEALADSVVGGPRAAHLEDWLGIFWGNRAAGRVLLAGQTRPYIVRALTELIEQRLAGLGPRRRRQPETPARLVAVLIAEGQVGAVHAWLSGRAAATAAAMAEMVASASAGAAARLYGLNEA